MVINWQRNARNLREHFSFFILGTLQFKTMKQNKLITMLALQPARSSFAVARLLKE
jgi:hypothetical protein